MTITRQRAIEIIKAHGWLPRDCTVSHTASNPCLNGLNGLCESFDSAMGVHESYILRDVKNWLGY